MGLNERANTVRELNIVAATLSDMACELAVAPSTKIIPCSYFNFSNFAVNRERNVCIK